MGASSYGLYSRWIFPWICELALNQPQITCQRQMQLADVGGEILEIGVGTGLNLPCYSPRVRSITSVEPNPGMNTRLQKRMAQTGIEIHQHKVGGESLPFRDGSFDFVVSSFTLCSIPNVEQALAEVHRVIKPGGQFVFLEHGLSPEPKIAKWQQRLNWLQGLLGDGCRLDVNVRELLAAIPFASVTIDNLYLEATPRTHGYLFRGSAVK